MALARIQYAADGSTDTFSVTFPYLAKSDVKVSVDGVEATDFTWPTSGSIKLTPTPSSGAIVDINRVTEKNRLLVDFQDGSTLLEKDLDLAARQSFFLAQESFDQTGSSLVVAQDGSYSASDRRISLLGYPTNPEDATSKQYVLDTFAQGEDTADARDESRNWANYPVDQLVPEGDQTDDYSALHHATKATDSAVSAAGDALSTASDAQSASTSASNAQASEQAAGASEVAAGISEVNAKASEDDVAANAQAAAISETNASTSESNALSSANAATSEAANASNSASGASISASNASQSATTAGSKATEAESSAGSSATSASNSSQSASAAATSETNASSSADAAASSATAAQTAETNAEGWAAGVNLPSAAGNGEKILRQKSDETGFEYIGEPYSKVEADARYAEITGGANANFTAMPQVGGDPIVESGSNADGEWTRWADGTQICSVSSTPSTLTTSTAVGALARGSVTWDFPIAFISTPTGCSSSLSANSNEFAVTSGGSTTEAIVTGWSVNGSSRTRSPSAVAIGRWK